MKKLLGILLLTAAVLSSCILMTPGQYILTPYDGQNVSGVTTILIQRPDDMAQMDTPNGGNLYIGSSLHITFDEFDFVSGQYDYAWDTLSGSFPDGPYPITVVMIDSWYPESPYSNTITVYVNNNP